jgi:flagellar assembly protein FliH
MSSGYIPKERLTAYERWEVAAFDEAERMAQVMQDAADAAPPAEAADPELTADAPPAEATLSPEELATLREQAMAEGRAAGFEAGFEEGFASGQAKGYASGEATMLSEVAAIAALTKNFTQAIEASEGHLADELLSLALDIAAQVLRTSLKTKPELILPVVREAIGALVNPHGHPTLAINPDDAALIRDQLGEQLSHSGWRLIEDPQIARGGCRVDNSGAEIDATLPSRWRRVIDSLGRQGDWLDGT